MSPIEVGWNSEFLKRNMMIVGNLLQAQDTKPLSNATFILRPGNNLLNVMRDRKNGT